MPTPSIALALPTFLYYTLYVLHYRFEVLAVVFVNFVSWSYDAVSPQFIISLTLALPGIYCSYIAPAVSYPYTSAL